MAINDEGRTILVSVDEFAESSIKNPLKNSL